MQVAKKHSTKNNMKHSQGNLSTGQITFGKNQGINSVSPTGYSSCGKELGKNLHESNQSTRDNK